MPSPDSPSRPLGRTLQRDSAARPQSATEYFDRPKAACTESVKSVATSGWDSRQPLRRRLDGACCANTFISRYPTTYTAGWNPGPPSRLSVRPVSITWSWIEIGSGQEEW